MKFYLKHILILILLFLGIIGCSENKNKLEGNKHDVIVISVDDNNYYSSFKTDSINPPQLIEADSAFIDKARLIIRKVTSPHPYFLARLFIDEKGRLDKVVIINSVNQEVDDFMIKNIKSWVFSPAEKEGKNLKYQAMVSLMKTRGDFSFSPPFFEKYFLTSESDYLSTADKMPELISINVHYPEIAKRAGIEGKVFIKAYLDEKGNVVSTEILKGIGIGCDEAAEKAVQEAKFKPGKQNNKPVKTQIVVPVLFKLDSSNSEK